MSHNRDPDPESSLPSFARSLPLFIAAGLFVVLGVAVLELDPHYGPGSFTLWALLIVLGFVAAIGGTASWLLVEDPTALAAPARGRPRGSRRSPEPPDEPEAPPTLDRSEFGRPAPAVRDRGTMPRYVPPAAETRPSLGLSPEWDEDGASESVTASPASAEPGYASASDALRDLDGIEEELAPRTGASRLRPGAATA